MNMWYLDADYLKSRWLIFWWRYLPYNPDLKERARELRNNMTKTESKKNITLLSILVFFIAIYSSFMSIWDFVIWLLLLTSLFHFKYHKALFILSITSVIIRLIATIEYFRYWLIDFDFFIPMFFSAMIAWFIAWYFVEKIDSKILEKLLKFIWVFLAIYIIFNMFL